MRSIAVCPLSKLDGTLKNTGANRLISLLSDATAFERPTNITPANHLSLSFNDITTSRTGLVSPSKQHVSDLIDFASRWDWTTPLLIHCWAGISRSPAAAAIVVLALKPDQDENALAAKLRNLAPAATPNIKMIEIADHLLERDGRFTSAMKNIGRGEEAFEGKPFSLEF